MDAETLHRRSYGVTALMVIAVAMTVVLGVQAFTAEGVPVAPTMVPVGAAHDQTGVFGLTILVESRAMGNQPPNGIDQLPPKLIYSAWIDDKPVALDTPTAFYAVSGVHNSFLLGATITIPTNLTTYNLTVEATAQVSTWLAVYLSPTVWENFSITNRTVYGDIPAPGVAPTHDFYWNYYGAATAMLAVDGGLAILALVTFERPIQHSLIPYMLILVLMLLEAFAWAPT